MYFQPEGEVNSEACFSLNTELYQRYKYVTRPSDKRLENQQSFLQMNISSRRWVGGCMSVDK